MWTISGKNGHLFGVLPSDFLKVNDRHTRMVFQDKIDLVVMGGRKRIREHNLVVKTARIYWSAIPQLTKHLQIFLPLICSWEILWLAAYRITNIFEIWRSVRHLALDEMMLLGFRRWLIRLLQLEAIFNGRWVTLVGWLSVLEVRAAVII